MLYSVPARARGTGTPEPGALWIGGHRADALVSSFGSPVYVFDAGVLRRRMAEVDRAVGDRVQVLFALKANPNVAVAQALCAHGAGVECASAGEIHIGLAAGVLGEYAVCWSRQNAERPRARSR